MKDREKRAMPRLLSVNVGLPRDVAWRGKMVHTAVWKTPVQGRRIARRLNTTVTGWPMARCTSGGRYRIGSVVFEVTQR